MLPVLPENPSLLTRVRVGIQTLLVLKDDPSNPLAGAMINDCFDLEVYEQMLSYMRESVSGRRILEERPSLESGDVDLDALAELPQGTLGRAFAQYFIDNKITPFSTTQPINSEVDYISKRYRETHDLYHLVTGYGTDVMGEMELQAFAMGNLGIRSPMLILPFGLVGMYMPASFVGAAEGPIERVLPGAYVRQLRAAYRRGAAAPPLITIRFEDHWESPVAALRERFIDGAAARAA